MPMMRVHVNEFRVQLPYADDGLMVGCVRYNSDNKHAPENTCSRDVLFLDGSVEELRSFAQAILDALSQPPPQAQTKQSESIDFKIYQGIPDDIPWL
jgi:hypothetical protein